MLEPLLRRIISARFLPSPEEIVHLLADYFGSEVGEQCEFLYLVGFETRIPEVWLAFSDEVH